MTKIEKIYAQIIDLRKYSENKCNIGLVFLGVIFSGLITLSGFTFNIVQQKINNSQKIIYIVFFSLTWINFLISLLFLLFSFLPRLFFSKIKNSRKKEWKNLENPYYFKSWVYKDTVENLRKKIKITTDTDYIIVQIIENSKICLIKFSLFKYFLISFIPFTFIFIFNLFYIIIIIVFYVL